MAITLTDGPRRPIRGVQKKEWGTSTAEIYDLNNNKKYWIGT
jgi:hypothetical protein